MPNPAPEPTGPQPTAAARTYGDGRDNRTWMVYLRCVRAVCPPEIVPARHPFETGWHFVTADLVARGSNESARIA